MESLLVGYSTSSWRCPLLSHWENYNKTLFYELEAREDILSRSRFTKALVSEPYTEHFGRIVILVQYVNATHLEYEFFSLGFSLHWFFHGHFPLHEFFFCFFSPNASPHPLPPITFLNGPSVSKQNTDLKCHRKVVCYSFGRMNKNLFQTVWSAHSKPFTVITGSSITCLVLRSVIDLSYK